MQLIALIYPTARADCHPTRLAHNVRTAFLPRSQLALVPTSSICVRTNNMRCCAYSDNKTSGASPDVTLQSRCVRCMKKKRNGMSRMISSLDDHSINPMPSHILASNDLVTMQSLPSRHEILPQHHSCLECGCPFAVQFLLGLQSLHPVSCLSARL